MHPLLESDSLECPHKGKVILQSSNKELFEVNNDGLIVESDLLNASIIGCSNTIAGFPTPCSCIATIPKPCISTLLEIEGEGVILIDNISLILTDKGFPLMLNGEAKAKDVFEIDENPSENRR
ncbi:hypothetical protein [Helicobacter didelphidarum]|uniref:hypothetical protein n=1 Tax=Helicobacter didelphidarum TaxID=2040648 RepID=UPI001FE48158|nr:hypothetical protein [Helicobacter didelphidarum]